MIGRFAGAMRGRLAAMIASHRIAASRLAGIAFFAVALLTESAHAGTLFSAVLFLWGLLLVGVATIGRLWCSLYISGYKNSQLITAGPYSLCRNPLYFFSFLGFAGLGFATETISLGLGLPAVAMMLYPAVIAREESELLARFGAQFEAYCASVPRFFPRRSGFTEPQQYTVNPALFRRTMTDVIWFVAFVGVLEFVEALRENQFVAPLVRLP